MSALDGFTGLGAALWGFGNYDAPDLVCNGIDSAGTTWVLGKVAGWKTTTAETPVQRADGADGGWFGIGTVAPRVLTLTGAFRAKTTALADTAEDQLRAALEHTAEDQTIWVAGTRPRQVTARLTGALEVVEVNPLFRTWSAVMTCADPYKYAAGAGGLITYTAGLPQLSGLPGLQFPLSFPADFGGGMAAVGRITVVNPGTKPVWPLVSYTTPTGTLDTPTLKHIGLSQAEGIARVLAAGDVVTVDHKNKSLLLNGQSVYGQRIPGCSFYPLAPGQSDLYFSANAYNAAALVSVSYRPRWS